MSSCFGSRKKSRANGDAEPLLPQYEDDTSLQRALHQKLHSYQMIRALSKGFMPSTEQVIINLRTLLAADLLNPETPGLSHSGVLLLKLTKQWLADFIELLRNKNDGDQIQDFIWYLLQSRIKVDAGDIVRTAGSVRAKADAAAAYASFQTVGSLLLTNSDFRIFLQDLNTIGRQVFSDAANTLSNVAEDAAHQIEPSEGQAVVLKNPGSESGPAPTTGELEADATEIASVVASGLKKTGEEAKASLIENISGDQKNTLIFRLKAAVTKLRQRNDYSDSVSTIGLLIERYALVYSRAADKTISTVQEDVDTNDELDRAIKNGWSLLSSFGSKEAWKELEKRTNNVMAHSQKDPEFETLMQDVASSIQKMLTDPEFFESAGKKVDELTEKSKGVGSESPLRQDIELFLQQVRVTYDALVNDVGIAKLIKTTTRLWDILSPTNATSTHDLFTDSYTVFVPLLVQAIQYIPIPRLEVSAPEMDLLLENVVLEPGRTINHSSFLPFRVAVETRNDLSLTKARFGTVTRATSLLTVRLQGLTLRAEELGFWMRARKGLLLRLLLGRDEGIASVALDGRGLDVAVDVEIGRDRLEHVLSLRGVAVRVHHLDYALRKSRFALAAWLLKPLLRPLLRRVVERQVSAALEDAFRAANRELLFARERLRATRISDPRDLGTFVRAVLTRLAPEPDPDMYASVGVTGGANVRGNAFAGVYAPGSVVKMWEQEGQFAGERVQEGAEGGRGWRNDIFDVGHVAAAAAPYT